MNYRLKVLFRNSFFLIFILILAPSVSSVAQRVSPFQPGSYFPGLVHIRDYAAIPAGIYIIDYNFWPNSIAYYDRNGNKFEGIEIDDPLLGTISLEVNPKLKGYSNSPVLFYSSRFKILGGARYFASIQPVYFSIDYDVYTNLVDSASIASGNVGGWGDFSFTPLALSWSFSDKVDFAFFYTLYAPTGRYTTGAENNIGQGFWTHQFQFPTYFYFLEQATALGIIPTLEVNGKVEDADFRAGNRFTLEYGISQYFTEWLEIELMNGHNWQISDDFGGDDWWKGTILDSRDRKSTFTAAIGVWPWAGRLQIRGKYGIDYGMRQRFKNQFWGLSFVFVTNLLAEKQPVD